MKYFDWNPEKNEYLKANRDIAFEEVIFCLMSEGLLDIVEHQNQAQYPNQKIFIVNVEGYAYLVPFVETGESLFLKTIIPSRKMTKMYLGGVDNET